MKKSSKILAGTALMVSLMSLSGCTASPVQPVYAPPPPDNTMTPQDNTMTPQPAATDDPEDPMDKFIPAVYGPPPTNTPTPVPDLFMDDSWRGPEE